MIEPKYLSLFSCLDRDLLKEKSIAQASIEANTGDSSAMPGTFEIQEKLTPSLEAIEQLVQSRNEHSTTPTPARDLGILSKLPAEIRLEIYGHTEGFFRPQFIHAVAPYRGSNHPLAVLWAPRSPRSSVDQYPSYAVPEALSFNSEAREEALKKYTLWEANRVFGFRNEIFCCYGGLCSRIYFACRTHWCSGSGGKRDEEPGEHRQVYVNPKVDMFVFGMLDFMLDDYRLEDPLSGPYASRQAPEAALANYNATFGVIRHVGVFLYNFVCPTKAEAKDDFIKYLHHFSELESLTIFIHNFHCHHDLEYTLPLEHRIEKAAKDSILEEASGLAHRFVERLLDRAVEDTNNPMKRRPKVEVVIYRQRAHSTRPGNMVPAVYTPSTNSSELEDPYQLNKTLAWCDKCILWTWERYIRKMKAEEDALGIHPVAN